jgi:hypothetical protein
MDRQTKLKQVAAIAVAYYLQQQGCIEDKCKCTCNWRSTRRLMNMNARIAVQSGGLVHTGNIA